MGSRSHPGGPLHRDSPPFAEEPSLSRWRPCRAHLVCRGAPVAVCTREPSLAAAAGRDPWVCHASHVGSMLPICMRFVLARACAWPPLEWFVARAMCSRSPSGGPSLAAAAGRGLWCVMPSLWASCFCLCLCASARSIVRGRSTHRLVASSVTSIFACSVRHRRRHRCRCGC